MFFRGQRTPPDDTPDTMFPHLSRITADMLRDEALRELHRLGFTTTWRPDGYISATRGEDTELIGLDNLSLQTAQAVQAGEDLTREDIATQVHNLLDAMSHRIDPAELSEADFLRQLKVRLVAGDMLTPVAERDSEQFSLSTRPWTDDLVVSLVIDTPTTVMTLPDKTLEARGLTSQADLEDLWHAGYRNLWQELTEAEIDVNEIHGDDPGANFWVIESGSFFLASAVLFLDELLPDWAPDLDTEAGIMVAAPHRHLLLVRSVTSGQDLLAGINTVTSVAVAQFTENPGPVSPKLHLMREGAEVLPFTDITDNDDGQRVIQVYPDAYLMDRINEGRDED
ncbi:hypothetical protein [Corynebacterium variabile]|uniref:Uncharacterized protein n=4 Tax=Corynebacterium variabile TaxID=1727 RepID=A0A3C0MVA1_9CORY|nr:hypothetical protein [Corynebacterium variabile]AEK35683.1 hypothetical protein CVAR_0335 [Corynebacterium variabile DSM 44702]MDN6240693.1 hypothetical protein [Corynebacterium variabile]MDN6477318.1 hypothetical protein [Corynebacterium variabile]MDN6536933.1 hypothetical protein [Corynebacterium variabile]MDN6662746.1 hypothetical protein [Corynebacterium variabile]